MGKAVTRVGLDKHIGHLSPTPNPFHQTAYANGHLMFLLMVQRQLELVTTTSCTGSSNRWVVNSICKW